MEDESVMDLNIEGLVNLASGEMVLPEQIRINNPDVNVVCGIGNPHRFLDTLSELGFVVEHRIYKDHHEFNKKDLIFTNEHPIFCTEKDAIKIMELDVPLEKIWFLKVSVYIPQEEERLSGLLALRKIEPISVP